MFVDDAVTTLTSFALALPYDVATENWRSAMRRTRHPHARALVSCCSVLVASVAFAAMPTLPSDGSNRIYVTDVAGAVDVTMAGQKRTVEIDTTVDLSARIITGGDGSIDIRQAL